MKKFTLALIALLSMTYMVEAQQYVSTEPANRNVIIEEFTGRNCGYCPIGHKLTHDLMEANPGRVWAINIHYQSSLSPTAYPNLNLPVSTTIGNAFPHSGIPMGVVNRSTASASETSSFTSTTNQQLSQAAECNVAGIAHINPEDRTVNITVEVYYTGNSSVDQNYLTVVMVQDSILGSQSDYGGYNPGGWLNGQYVHQHALRDIITPTWGDAITPTTQGTLVTKNYQYQIPESIGNPNGVAVDLDHIDFVAFVTEKYQGTPTRPILNGAELTTEFMTEDALHPYVRKMRQTDRASCDNIRSFRYEFMNIGTQDITSMKYTVQIGETMNEFEWTGNVPSGERTNLEFDMEFDFGTYTGVYTITEVNGEAYNASTNFAAECLQLAETDVENDVTTLKVFIIQDQYGEQTTWDILNSAGETVASGGPYEHLSGAGTKPNTVTINNIPTDECYLFRIFDSNNDGICCNYGNGQYYVKDVHGQKIVEGAGNFGSKAQQPFRINNRPDAVTNNAVKALTIYPNPANNMLYVEGENVELVEIYNSLGQKVLAVDGVSGTNSIDVASFDNGVYVVRVVANDGITTQKVSIAR